MKKLIAQSVLIKAAPGSIFKELVVWGQGQWWPRKCLMEFMNLSGRIGEGTVYLQKVKIPFAPRWHTKNEIVDNNKFYIKRVFLDGMFRGFEEVNLYSQDESLCKAEYSFNCNICGFINRVIWNRLFEKLHKKNIDLILASLKRYMER